MENLNVEASAKLVQAIQERKKKSREEMGRPYLSEHEAWAKLKEQLEAVERDLKNVKSLHGDIWKAIKEGNDEEVTIELREVASEATSVAMTLVALAATAYQAAEDLGG